jgi:hypothetical protein
LTDEEIRLDNNDTRMMWIEIKLIHDGIALAFWFGDLCNEYNQTSRMVNEYTTLVLPLTLLR